MVSEGDGALAIVPILEAMEVVRDGAEVSQSILIRVEDVQVTLAVAALQADAGMEEMGQGMSDAEMSAVTPYQMDAVPEDDTLKQQDRRMGEDNLYPVDSER
ncbi:hypothetical protein PR202_gb12597 [Eleusine coracana subsp. coracana]|uniref:Uncharacterized protein n=1 Tax=Eleusine coracana subsp. coracana TaxID=191504 RepID=A0AAV5EQA8_ELECO|nr:hypothetical protein PR202_gb12597 [Eleusine coracana subsp. coracana]